MSRRSIILGTGSALWVEIEDIADSPSTDRTDELVATLDLDTRLDPRSWRSPGSANQVISGTAVNILGLGCHQDTGRGRVDPALRLGDRYPLDAVHPTLELQSGPDAIGGQRGRSTLVQVDGADFTLDEDAAAKNLGADAAPILEAAIKGLDALPEWTAAGIEDSLKATLVDGLGLKPRKASSSTVDTWSAAGEPVRRRSRW